MSVPDRTLSQQTVQATDMRSAFLASSSCPSQPSQPSYGEDIEDDRYRASRPARTVSHSHNGQPSTDERGYRLPPPSGRIPSGQHSPPSQANEDLFRPPPQGPDDHYDQGTLLARRRGDAAQAKASKLHIDVGSAASDRSLESSAPPPLYHGHPRSSIDASLIARSAPPSKLSFSEREPPSAPSSDPRGGPPRGEPGFASSSPHYPPGIVHTQRGGPPSRMYPEGHNGAHGQTILRSPPHGRHTPISGGEPPCSSARLGPGGSGPPQLPPSSSTPLTSRFVPHTATLPSPAYHTTRMMQGPAGNSMLPQGSGPSVQAPPKTTNLTPGPPTARIPDHLRSPPSSKTQFLSLFSNFYDSLSDSRMLKATLEDQVRRSNALLQTLQKSSKVLEATVDRKIREERSVWESKVKHLEARIARLEGGEPVAQSNSSSPTQSGRRGSAQESVNGAEDARSGSVSPLSSGEAAREMREQTTRDSGDQTTEGQALGSDGGDREEHSDGGNK